MTKIYPILPLILTILLGCNNQEAETGGETAEISDQLGQWAATLTDDQRTDRLRVAYAGETEGRHVFRGHTTIPGAVHRMDSLFAATYDTTRYRLEISPLPGPRVPAPFGLVRNSVANLRTRPSHGEELTSQALMGMPLELLDLEDGWYLVRTPDRYIAYLEEGAVVPRDRAQMEAFFDDRLRVHIGAPEEIFGEAGDRVISDLPTGALFRELSESPSTGFTHVELPDGRRGYTPRNLTEPYLRFAATDAIPVMDVLSSARRLSGRPYLWGGTSDRGMDCSGFTKMSYYLNGFVIPRDASQQVREGREVVLTEDLRNLRAGDLLFFGYAREDGSERINHVGFYLGEGRFLHAGADNGHVTENSFRPEDADFAEHRLKSLRRVRRLEANRGGVRPVGEAFSSLYTKSSSR